MGGRTQRKEDEPYIREEKEKEKKYTEQRNLRIKKQKEDEEYFRTHRTAPYATSVFGEGAGDAPARVFNKAIEYGIGKPI